MTEESTEKELTEESAAEELTEESTAEELTEENVTEEPVTEGSTEKEELTEENAEEELTEESTAEETTTEALTEEAGSIETEFDEEASDLSTDTDADEYIYAELNDDGNADADADSYVVVTLNYGYAINDDGSSTAEQIIALGTELELPTLERNGFIFGGWYENADYEGDALGDTYTVAEAVTLYAKWTDTIWFEDVPDQVYTGSKIKPDIKVYYGSTLLTYKTDYSVTYKNNLNVADKDIGNKAPTVYVGIKNKNLYLLTGIHSLSKTFSIVPLDMSDASISVDEMTLAYTGSSVTAEPTIYLNNKKISSKYYDVSDNVQTEVGDYMLTITGTGNFTGTRTACFTITKATLLSDSKIKVTAKSMPYTGNEIILDDDHLIIRYGKSTLQRGTDYTVESYSNNIDAGTAEVKLRGIGDYAGVRTVEFTITGVSISKVKISGIESFTYDGSEKELSNLKLVYNNTVLNNHDDYELSYEDNVNAGTATVEIIGAGRYTGTVTKRFKINKLKMNAGDFTATAATAVYSKGGATTEAYVTYNGNELEEDIDYTISYKNNKALTTDSKKAKAVIKGKGNFTGNITAEFDIVAKDLSEVSIIVPDKVSGNKAGKWISTPVLTDTDGKKLQSNKDYDKNLIYTLTDSGTQLDKKAIVSDIGTKITVTVTAKGSNYTGTITAEYCITELDFSKANIKIASQEYTEDEITVSSGDIVVKIGKKELEYGEDYEIIEGSYYNNINVGTAKVTLKGIGEYGGIKTASFKIYKPKEEDED